MQMYIIQILYFSSQSEMKIANLVKEIVNTDMQSAQLLSNNNNNVKSINGSLENGQITQFYFHKLLKIEFCLSITIILNFINIVVNATLSFPDLKQDNQNIASICLNFNIVCVIIQMILIFIRSQTSLQLEKQQKLIYQKATIVNTKKLLYLLFQYTVVLIQPYYFLNQYTFQNRDYYNQFSFRCPVNDILTILSLFRLFMLFRTLLLITPYMSNRSNRLCKMYGCKADFTFSLKCLFKDSPLFLVINFFSISLLTFSYAIYIAERRLSLYSQSSSTHVCNSYLNSIWMIAITVTTVGYGDYFPHTAVGRIIIMFVAIWGTFIVSIMVVVVASTLNMQKNQRRTLLILDKLYAKDQLREKASKFIGIFILSRMLVHKDKERANKYASMLTGLKNIFSSSNRQIKLMKADDDIYDEIAYHFLNLNSDIQILNENQQKIIDFIHKNLQYHQKGEKRQQN